MNTKKQTPDPRSEDAGVRLTFDRDKDTKLLLTPTQQRLLNLLSDGGMYSVADISTRLRLCDPRGVIRNVRRSGVAIFGVWVRGALGVRFKRYFFKADYSTTKKHNTESSASPRTNV